MTLTSYNDTKKIFRKKFKPFKLEKRLVDVLSTIKFYDNCTFEKLNENVPKFEIGYIQKLINEELVTFAFDEVNNVEIYSLTEKAETIIHNESNNQIFDAFSIRLKLHVLRSIKTLLFFMYQNKKNKKLIWLSIIFSIISAICLSLSILSMGQFPDIFAKIAYANMYHQDFSKFTNEFIINISLMAGFYILQVIFLFLQNVFFVYISQNMGYKIRKEMFFKIQKLPFSYMDRQSAGNVMSLFTNDVDSVVFTVVQNIAQVINAFFTVIALLITMFLLDYLLAAVTVFLTFIMLSIIFFFIKKSQPYFMDQQKKLAEINGDVVEAMNVHKMTVIFDYQEEMQKSFNKKNKELAKSSYLAQLISGVIFPYNNFVTNFVISVVSLLCTLLFIFDRQILESTSPLDMNIVSLVLLFIITIRQFTTPISNFFFTLNSFQLTFAATERINELLNEKNESSDENKANLQISNGKIEFKNISFKYAKFGKNIINNLNLTLEPNTVNAIAGPTGSGKTTIISLLTRFYDLNQGSILIDGTDISKVTRESVRDNISIVLQDSYLFSTTILENIRCARPEATREEVIKAAKLSNAHEFIMRLPNGYDTKIDNGIDLISAGEKQLIAIARAFLSKAKIIIFDEATSYVDTKTEKDIQEAMNKLMKNRTSILIAHRLSTIKDADQIAIIKDGILIEKGNHNQLMSKKGFYYKLNSSLDSDMDIKN